MGNLASLTFLLRGDIKGFQTSMRQAGNIMRKTGASMKKIGGQMSMYVTAPIVAMGAASLAAFDKQAQAEAKLAAQIRSNGKEVETTMTSYKEFASSLQNITTVGDETTLGLMQLAETMQSSNVKLATQDAIGLSKALGIDLQTALKMVVLAQKGEYTMLNRYIPALKTANSETEKAAIVSKLYADGMQIAKAEAQTGLGPLKQLKNTIGDLSEEFGLLIADAIKPVVEWLKHAAESFQGLSTKGKKTVAIITGIAAAIGPVTIALGAMLTVLPAIGAAFMAMLGPVGLVVAAIAAIATAFVYVYDNWEAFKERLSDWNWWRNAIVQSLQWLIKYNPISALLDGYNELLKVFGMDTLGNPFHAIAETLDGLKIETKEYQHEFKDLGDSLIDTGKKVAASLGLMYEGMKKSTRELLPEITELESRLGNLTTTVVVPVLYKIDDTTLPPPPTYIDEYTTSLTEFGNTSMAIGEAVSGTFENMGNRLVESFGLAKTGFDGFVGGILSTVIKLISMMLASALAQSISGATSSGSATGPAAVITTPIFIAAAVAGVLGAFAAIPKLASGGIVPGGFPNDTYPAFLSSGETVIPSPIPLSGGALGGNNIHITGTLIGRGNDLVTVIDKAVIRRTRTRGY